MRLYFVYLLASESRRLYVGFSGDLVARVYRHHHDTSYAHTRAHRITKLVYFETSPNAYAAITREKQLKRWPRARKIRLIEKDNAGWRDLSADWFPEEGASRPYDADGCP
jgi:putative endonuclease